MRRKIGLMILALVLFFLLPVQAEDRGELFVLSNNSCPTKFFIDFFYHFNDFLLDWWKAGGKNQVKGRWGVFVVPEFPDCQVEDIIVFIINNEEGNVSIVTAHIPALKQINPVSAAQTAVKKTTQILVESRKIQREK